MSDKKVPLNMNGIPKKQFKLMRGLSDYLSSCLDNIIDNNIDLDKKVDLKLSVWAFGRSFNYDYFQAVTNDFTDQQWQILIEETNKKIAIKLKEEEKEEKMSNDLLLRISEDEILKYHNINVLEIGMIYKKSCAIKVSFVCGTYFLEGTIKELISDMRFILKDNNVDVRIFCPNCSSKQLRFMDDCCLCNDCGAFSSISENKVIKQYKLEDKQFWWAKVLAEFG